MSLPELVQAVIGRQVSVSKDSLTFAVVRRAHALAERHPLGLLLAAGFDLIVASRYYENIGTDNWLWCEECGLDLYPFLNACPVCVLDRRFVHFSGNKQQSGVIGPTTADVLREVLAAHYAAEGKQHLAVHVGQEPVDVALVDTASQHVLLAEVKASPLFTPAVAVVHDPDSFHDLRPVAPRHSVGRLRGLDGLQPNLVVPWAPHDYLQWPLPADGMRQRSWASQALTYDLTRTGEAFEKYALAWMKLWELYRTRDKGNPAFWHTGACGRPVDPGENWPKDSSGKPTGTISDGKTSVGMDRTDDLKKSTFQVLNLGVRLRGSHIGEWGLAIGLASNLEAARHHRTYLSQYEDIVWGWSADSAPPAAWYNLFDGVISFSKSHSRDPWIKEVVDWH